MPLFLDFVRNLHKLIIRLCFVSISPPLMPNRKAVQFLTVMPPFRHELVHQGHETAVVRRLQQMDHFMHDDVFQALVAASWPDRY